MVNKKDVSHKLKKVKAYRIKNGELIRKDDLIEIEAVEYEGVLFEHENIVLFYLNKDRLRGLLYEIGVKEGMVVDLLSTYRSEVMRDILKSEDTTDLYHLLKRLNIYPPDIKTIINNRIEILRVLRKLDSFTYTHYN